MSDELTSYEELCQRFRIFLEDNDINRMCRNLRKVLIEYVRNQNAGLDVEFEYVLNDLEAIFDLLDFAIEANEV